ncbi:MAG: hypothetical protein U0165_11375 [Polyangiaceae bacterium]
MLDNTTFSRDGWTSQRIGAAWVCKSALGVRVVVADGCEGKRRVRTAIVRAEGRRVEPHELDEAIRLFLGVDLSQAMIRETGDDSVVIRVDQASPHRLRPHSQLG